MHTQFEEARITNFHCNETKATFDLADGRSIIVPIAWYPRLANGTPAQRENWRLIGSGLGVHWPELDEDLSCEGLLTGASAPKVLNAP